MVHLACTLMVYMVYVAWWMASNRRPANTAVKGFETVRIL